jgi:hypothetical protein
VLWGRYARALLTGCSERRIGKVIRLREQSSPGKARRQALNRFNGEKAVGPFSLV